MSIDRIPYIFAYIKGLSKDFIIPNNDLYSDAMVHAWFDQLKDLPEELVLLAIKQHFSNSPYQITVSDIRKNALNIVNPDSDITPIEAWNEAKGAISNGLYMTQEQFETLSPLVKRFFHDVRQIRELAQQDMYEVNTVVKGQFLKQFEILKNREQEEKIMLPDVRNAINGLIDKMDINLIGDAS